MTFTTWISGLPGSGKSTIARELLKKLDEKNIRYKYLRLDEIRKQFVPEPKYTDEERDFVYSKLVEIAAETAKTGNVIVDATAHKKEWRDSARRKIKNFMEVYVKCSLEICIERESSRKQGLVTAELYKKALDRKLTGKEYPDLGQVIGVDVPYEENENAEIIIDSEKLNPEEAAEIIMKKIKA